MRLTRRRFVQAVASLPLVSLACGRPETPLAHLHGQDWVHGAYEMYAKRYLTVQLGAEASSNGAYRVLAQKGVTALDGLQSREVPFFMRVDPETDAFHIERTVPDRLTFTADMTEADRQAATAGWEKARSHIHTDYAEIHRLNWAMTTLLEQLDRIHAAMDEGEIEQFKIVRQLVEMRGGGDTPFELPAGVSRADYERVTLLLLARIEDDRHRLEVIEASIVAVGLTSRATDAGSGSLAFNIHKVLLSVIADAQASEPAPAVFPKQGDEQERLVAGGRKLAAEIEASPEYKKWEKDEQTKTVEQIGALLPVVDAFTHIPTSAIFHEVIGIWKGEGDYLLHLKTLAMLVPGGGQVSKTLVQAIEVTEKVRRVARTVERAAATAQRGLPSKDALIAEAQAAAFEQAGGLLNTATQFGRSRLEKQLAFLTDHKELRDVQAAVQQSQLVTQAMPELPPLPAVPQ